MQHQNRKIEMMNGDESSEVKNASAGSEVAEQKLFSYVSEKNEII